MLESHSVQETENSNNPEDIVVASAEPTIEDEVVIELSDEARVGFALYLQVMKSGRVSPKGTKIPNLSTKKLSIMAEVSIKQVSKLFERLRAKGFIINDELGELYIPDILSFEEWLRREGAALD